MWKMKNIYGIAEDQREQIKSLTKQINKPNSTKARKRIKIIKQQQQNIEIIRCMDDIILKKKKKYQILNTLREI